MSLNLFLTLIQTVVAIAGFIFSIITGKKAVKTQHNGANNVTNASPQMSTNTSIENKTFLANRKTLYSILAIASLFLYILTFSVIIYLNRNSLPNLSFGYTLSFFNKFNSYLYYGINLTTKVFFPVVVILCITIVIQSWIIKTTPYRTFKLITYALLGTTNTLLAIITYRHNLMYTAQHNPIMFATVLSLQTLLPGMLIIIFQFLFIPFEIIILMNTTIIPRVHSNLLSVNMKYYLKPIILLILSVLLLLYNIYILHL